MKNESEPLSLRRLFDEIESGKAQRFYRIVQLTIAYQNIIGLVSANRQNPDIRVRERHSDGNQNPDKIQIKRPDDFAPAPTATRLDAGRNKVFLTNHGKLVPRAADRKERLASSPIGNWSVDVEPTHREPLGKDDKL